MKITLVNVYKVLRTCLAPSQLFTDVQKCWPFVVLVSGGGATPKPLPRGRQHIPCREPGMEKAMQSLMPPCSSPGDLGLTQIGGGGGRPWAWAWAPAEARRAVLRAPQSTDEGVPDTHPRRATCRCVFTSEPHCPPASGGGDTAQLSGLPDPVLSLRCEPLRNCKVRGERPVVTVRAVPCPPARDLPGGRCWSLHISNVIFRP